MSWKRAPATVSWRDETIQRIPWVRELAVASGHDCGRTPGGSNRERHRECASVVAGPWQQQQRLSARFDSLCERGLLSPRKTDRASLPTCLYRRLRGESGRDEKIGRASCRERGMGVG